MLFQIRRRSLRSQTQLHVYQPLAVAVVVIYGRKYEFGGPVSLNLYHNRSRSSWPTAAASVGGSLGPAILAAFAQAPPTEFRVLNTHLISMLYLLSRYTGWTTTLLNIVDNQQWI